jgi:glycosyltransferase involved in cell wall biosynthesis
LKALVIDDLGRKGGGQARALITANVLEHIGYDTFFLTNVESVDGHSIRVAYKVDYQFVENSSGISDLMKIVKLKRQLNDIDVSKFDVSINNHPNVFLKNASINVLHGFSFLDPWIDENGEIVKHLPPKILKMMSLYSIYNHSFFSPNSRYTKEISDKLFEKLGLTAEMGDVIYHPIVPKEVKTTEKKAQALLLARINRNKGIEEAIKMAKESSFRLIIAGYVNKGDERFVERLRRDAGEGVTIFTNINEDEKERLLNESSTILSLNRKENFGLSIAEGMSHGCVPVVPQSGGPWVDIVDHGKYGLGFIGLEEMGESVNRSFGYGESDRIRIAKSVERFSFQEYERKVRNAIEYIETRR